MSFSKLFIISVFIVRSLHIVSPVEEYSRFIESLVDKMDVDFSDREETSTFIKYLVEFPFIDYIEVWERDGDIYIVCEVKYLFKGFKFSGLKKWEIDWLTDILPYRKGEYYTLNELREGERLIVESLEKDGYRISEHTFNLRLRGKDAYMEFGIVSGKREKVLDVSINVPPRFKKYAKRLLKLKNRFFSRLKVKESVEKLRENLVNEGYYENVVKWDFEKVDGGVRVRVDLIPGLMYKFRVLGDTEHFSSDDFKKIGRAIYQEEGYISSDLLLKKVKEVLSKAGVGDSTIRIKTLEGSDSITFLAEIEEKEGIFIKRIIFKGARSFSEDLLKKQMKSSEGKWYKRIFDEDNGIFLPDFVSEDIRRIEEFYRMNSFLDAKCSFDRALRERDGLFLIYSINEGKRYIVREIVFQRFIKVPGFEVISSPVPYHIFREWLSQYREHLTASGYRNVRLDISTEKVDEDEGNIYIKVTVRCEGSFVPYKVGEIFFYGERRLSNSIAYSVVRDMKGNVFNANTRLKIYSRLSSLEYFKNVGFVEIDNPLLLGTTDLGIALEEVKQFRILGGLGYATEEGARTFLSFSFPDIKGSAVDLVLYGKGAVWVDSFQPRELFKGSNYDLSILQGRVEVVKKVFLSPDWRLGSIVNYQHTNRPNYEIKYLELSLIGRGVLEGGLTMMTGYTYRMRDPIKVPPEYYPEGQFYSIGFLTYEVVYDRRNHPVIPTSGFIMDVRADLGLRALISESDYVKLTFKSKLYLSSWRFIFSFFFRTGYAHVFTPHLDIPIEEKFFLGGANSIRGFEEDSVGPPLTQKSKYYSTTGGDFMLNYGAEMQFSLTRTFFIGIFFDGGGAFNLSKAGFDSKDLREGAGFGFKWKTPIGEMSADMGFKLDRRSGEKLNVFHFSVGRFI